MTTGFIHNPHDRLFRASLAQVRIAREFFARHLPTKFQAILDLNTLKIEKDTFIEDNFKASEADLLYSVTLHDQSRAYLYLLCEHASNVDKNIAFRILVYVINIMKQHHAQHPNEPLPLVVPLVLYTGKETWTVALDIFPLFGAQSDLARELWPPTYQLIDVHRLSDEELLQHDFSGLLEYVFKYAAARDVEHFLAQTFPWLRRAAKKDIQQAMLLGKYVVFYTLGINENLDKSAFHRLAEKHLGETPLRSEIMTLAEQFRQEGREEVKTLAEQFRQQGETAVLKRLLTQRFGPLESLYLKKLEHAKHDQLLIWEQRILHAQTPSEVFEEEGKNF